MINPQKFHDFKTKSDNLRITKIDQQQIDDLIQILQSIND